MSEFIMKASTDEQAEFCRRYSNMQELVRCKDCEHCYFASNRIPSEQNYACGKHGFDVAPDWFCADGVAKDINVPNKEGR